MVSEVKEVGITREWMYRIGLTEGWLGCKSESEKSILRNGLAMGKLPFKNALRELMYRIGLAEGWLVFK